VLEDSALRPTTNKNLLLNGTCHFVIIIVLVIEEVTMTFSEYVNTFAMKQYLEYCQQKNLLPHIDIKVKPQPICALLKPLKEKTL
jgi:hypothetical protein